MVRYIERINLSPLRLSNLCYWTPIRALAMTRTGNNLNTETGPGLEVESETSLEVESEASLEVEMRLN